MNEIIIIRASYNNHKIRKNSDEGSRIQGQRGIDPIVDMGQYPNLKINMLKKERFSEKRHYLRVNQTSMDSYQLGRRKKTEDVVDDMNKNNYSFEKRIEEALTTPHQKELFFKRNFANIKKLRFYFQQQNKMKETSNSINKFNATAQIATIRNKRQAQSSRISQQRILNLSKSQSCKTRPLSNMPNPQQLLEIHQKKPIYDNHKRLFLHLNKEKHRQLYEQAVSHLQEMTKSNFFHDKARSEMPCELDVNKINIPRRNHRQQWAQKMKKYQQSAIKHRQEQEQLRLAQGKKGKEKHSVKKIKLRAKTDSKIVQKGTRNQTEFINKMDLWMELIDKHIAPWEFDGANSKFYQ